MLRKQLLHINPYEVYQQSKQATSIRRLRKLEV